MLGQRSDELLALGVAASTAVGRSWDHRRLRLHAGLPTGYETGVVTPPTSGRGTGGVRTVDGDIPPHTDAGAGSSPRRGHAAADHHEAGRPGLAGRSGLQPRLLGWGRRARAPLRHAIPLQRRERPQRPGLPRASASCSTTSSPILPRSSAPTTRRPVALSRATSTSGGTGEPAPSRERARDIGATTAASFGRTWWRPRPAHAAFTKAADYVDVDLVRVAGGGPTSGQAATRRPRPAPTTTIMVVGSAPTYPRA